MENLAARLKELCSANNEDGLKSLALELGFAEAGKTMANLVALHDVFKDENLLASLATIALTTADPDQALLPETLENGVGAAQADAGALGELALGGDLCAVQGVENFEVKGVQGQNRSLLDGSALSITGLITV